MDERWQGCDGDTSMSIAEKTTAREEQAGATRRRGDEESEGEKVVKVVVGSKVRGGLDCKGGRSKGGGGTKLVGRRVDWQTVVRKARAGAGLSAQSGRLRQTTEPTTDPPYHVGATQKSLCASQCSFWCPERVMRRGRP